MNARTALIACIFTILLSAAAVWLLRTAPQTTPTGPELPTWVRTLDSTPLTGLALTHATQPGRSELVRSADLPLFVLQANAAQPAWPIDETRIRSAARLIADSAKAAAVATGLFTPGYTVTWSTPAGPQSLTLSDAPSWLGGFAQLRFDAAAASPVLRVQTDLAKLFTPEALLAWRSPTIFPALQASEAGGVSIQTMAGVVTLKKSGTQWGMPDYRINADADAVAQVVRTLTALGATRLIGVADAAASQTTPTMILEMRSSVNSVAAGSQDVTRRVLVQSVRVFGAADASGKTLLAVAKGAWEESPDQPLWGPMQLAINAADIATIPTDAAKLASRVLLDVPAADITRLYLGHTDTGEDLASTLLTPPQVAALESGSNKAAASMVKREVNGWSLKNVRASGSKEASRMEPLLTLLCKTPAAHVQFAPIEGAKAWMTLIASTAKGPHAMIGIATGVDSAGKRVLVVRSGGAYYVFGPEAAVPVIDVLEELLPVEG